MKRYLFLLLIAFSGLHAQQPDKEGSYVKWISLEEAMEKMESKPKPMLVDFYTDWCGWCKTMMKTTYANPDLANYINTYFYPVKFDAEGKDTIEYLGEKYFPLSKEPRTTHPLAAKLLNNKLMYPTTIFYNGYDKEKKEFKLNMIASGYLEQVKLEPILVYILENASRNASYDEFNSYFQKTFFDSTLTQKQKMISWVEPVNAFNGPLPKKKKTIVLINAAWCSTCKVMKSTSFIDSTVEEYLKEKFFLVDFNPELTDTIQFKNQTYINTKTPEAPFHQLALMLGKNSITFPSLIILDENLDVIDNIPSYISPHFLKDIIHYYGENTFKNKSWTDYMKMKKDG
jgi:thioredoxin-related protein